ncbi:phage Gp37/Gp68 family protein [Leptolyngbya sp. FACHB-36]|uniref:DUF5131 family protein n=1 Tax=Leptolyngbya sp. FACHB-36 TaxID=2692808 RepID=UPI00167FEE85|nr:DUF5131 family protein [Leptolyngbya sp. FACHB-36]MBD2019403.1 phage Gp37/Gp68 family protein [Leptolyngbya sp. FACHB-36]
MAETTKIQWTDHTFNPHIGCEKISPGCANCYAEKSTPSRVFRVRWGKSEPRRRTSNANWKEPLAWNRKAAREGIRRRVFCASLSDWLDPESPISWLADLLRLIEQTPNLDWLMLTKRIHLWEDRLHAVVRETHGGADTIASLWLDGQPPENVWLGTTVEDQKRADDRIPLLLQTPAVVRFLSVEPLLESVSLQLTPDGRSCIACEDGSHQLWECHHILAPRPDWVILGGESGFNARPCHLEWIRKVVQQCQDSDVPVFVKQLGSAAIDGKTTHFFLNLKDRKGGNIEEFPVELQVREFPLVTSLKYTVCVSGDFQ